MEGGVIYNIFYSRMEYDKVLEKVGGGVIYNILYSRMEYDKVLGKVGGGVLYNILYSRMEYDKVLEKVGGFGLYQKFLCYVLVFYTTFLCGINFYTQVRILQLISSYNR